MTIMNTLEKVVGCATTLGRPCGFQWPNHASVRAGFGILITVKYFNHLVLLALWNRSNNHIVHTPTYTAGFLTHSANMEAQIQNRLYYSLRGISKFSRKSDASGVYNGL